MVFEITVERVELQKIHSCLLRVEQVTNFDFEALSNCLSIDSEVGLTLPLPQSI